MAITYKIEVLDAQGDVILSTCGRAGALNRAIRELQDFRTTGKAASGQLFVFDRTRRDTIRIDGIAGLVEGEWGGLRHADDLIADLDRRGAEGTRVFYARCAASFPPAQVDG